MPDIVKVTFTIQDSKERNGHVLYYSVIEPYFTVLGGQYMEALKFYYQELAKRLDALITGRIVAINISIDCQLPAGMKVAPLVNSDVEEGAEFKFPAAAGSAYFRHRVPTFDHSLFGYGSKTVEFHETPELSAYTMLMFQSEDASDWADEYGTITDNRGNPVNSPPLITKNFQASRG